MLLTVSQLWIYPVKSCRAIAVEASDVDELGLAGDRRFLITDLQGKALTQRSHPQMARVETHLDNETLTLASVGHGSITISRDDDQAAPVLVNVWDDRGLQTEDCGADAADWLSATLQTPARLVRIGRTFDRPVHESAVDRVAFADAYPLLVISEASLARLNERLVTRDEEPVPMSRFRPNIVIAGATPHAEDQWRLMTVGDVVLRPTTPCARCSVTTTDQSTGERGHEPLRTLAGYRRDLIKPQQINFGRNVINVSKHGRIHVGQTVTVQ